MDDASRAGGEMEEEEEEVHVLAVPFQAEGHIKGMLRLAHTIAHMGVTVTFVYPARFHALDCKRAVSPVKARSRLRFEVAEDGLPLDEECPLTAELLRTSIPIFRRSVKLILDRLLSEDAHASSSSLPCLCCIISDAVVPWTQGLADAAALPRIPFWTSTAASYSMSAHLPLLISGGHLPVKKDSWVQGKKWMLEAPLVECIPGLSPFPITELPSEFCQSETLSNPSLQFLAAACEHGKEAPCILVHSIHELEGRVFDALQTEGFDVESVGPLLYHSVTQKSSHESLQWLNVQASSSVIYVALGSVSHLSPAETHALALGLEASGCPFLWVMRPDEVSASCSEVLPEGFYGRMVVRHPGLILSWVPQEEVLHHAAVGAFFSHCGWNSTLESMWEGVPMVACPLGMEQRSNARWIVEHWKMGVELKRQVDGSFTKEAVEEALLEVMVNEAYRKGAVHMKQISRQVVQEGGSSYSSLIRVKKLLGKCHFQRMHYRKALSRQHCQHKDSAKLE